MTQRPAGTERIALITLKSPGKHHEKYIANTHNEVLPAPALLQTGIQCHELKMIIPPRTCATRCCYSGGECMNRVSFIVPGRHARVCC